MIITENGIEYDVEGDYPDGKYVKQILNKGTLPKTVYTRADFIAKLPKSKVRDIQAVTPTNDDINVWVFNLPMVDNIDLNDLPTWFTEGLEAMITEGIFTENQIKSFLEIE